MASNAHFILVSTESQKQNIESCRLFRGYHVAGPMLSKLFQASHGCKLILFSLCPKSKQSKSPTHKKSGSPGFYQCPPDKYSWGSLRSALRLPFALVGTVHQDRVMPCCAPPSTHIVNRGCDGTQDIFEGLELTGRDLRKEKSTLTPGFIHLFIQSFNYVPNLFWN